jgi:predicted nucleic acid-binding protein
MTREWWNDNRTRFELFASQAVVDECTAGDPTAAQERLVFLEGIPVLAIHAATRNLAQELMLHVGLPAKAAVDAVHIATAALNRIDYLLTWNCKHIANPAFRRRIEDVLDDAGLRSPVICTPQEMLNV